MGDRLLEVGEAVEVRRAVEPQGTSLSFLLPHPHKPMGTTLLPTLGNLPFNPPIPTLVGGSLEKHAANWEGITSDPWVLQTTKGYHLELTELPRQSRDPFWPKFSQVQRRQLDVEIQKLLNKGAIERAVESSGQFLSFLFLREKKDGSQRPIINLKPFNQCVTYHHFKMEGIHLVLDMIQSGEYFTKIDLKDAYFSVAITEEHRKYLRFRWGDQLYQFRACPFGLASAPRMFTKLMKPITPVLRRMGIKMVIYLDDMIFLHQDPVLLEIQTQSAIWVLQHLGFQINWEKSITTPAQSIEFLGFEIDAIQMKVKLPVGKMENIQKQCQSLMQTETMTVRELAALIGKLVAAVRAVTPGPLHFRNLQMQKTKALLQSGMNYEALVILTPECKAEVQWWAEELNTWNGNSFIKPCADMTLHLTSDASKKGWGATCGNQTAQGQWSSGETTEHINVLEMKAALFAITAFTKTMTNKHVHIKVVNMTTVANINKKGGTRSKKLLEVANQIWQYGRSQSITITAEYLPGILNTRADYQSRNFLDSSNWRLNPDIFKALCNMWGPLTMDLFADRLNTQLSRFVSWKPDPEAETTDAFAIPWEGTGYYAFPPFCLISRCLAKVHQAQSQMVLITPVWQTQPWYAKLLQMIIDLPILLPQTRDLLTDPLGNAHPLVQANQLQLAAWNISSDHWQTKGFLKKLANTLPEHAEKEHNLFTTAPGKSGIAGVWDNTLIHFKPLWPM